MALMSPLRYRLHIFWNSLPWNREVISEVADHYLQNLPEKIQVAWERDGKMIVGKIFADGEEFFTQGDSANEFIKMVNDAIYAAYNIPPRYIPAIEAKRLLRPSAEEWQKLNDMAVKKSALKFSGESKKVVA